jgi:hypothetical protein
MTVYSVLISSGALRTFFLFSHKRRKVNLIQMNKIKCRPNCWAFFQLTYKYYYIHEKVQCQHLFNFFI